MPIRSSASMTRKPLAGYHYGSAEPFVIVNWQGERHPVLSRTLAPCRLHRTNALEARSVASLRIADHPPRIVGRTAMACSEL